MHLWVSVCAVLCDVCVCVMCVCVCVCRVCVVSFCANLFYLHV